MQGRGHQVEDSIGPVGGRALGLLRDEGHRTGFIEESEFAVRVLRIGGIQEDSPRDDIAVEIRHQRPDVPAVLAFDFLGPVAVEATYRYLHSAVPPREVALVNAVILAHPW